MKNYDKPDNGQSRGKIISSIWGIAVGMLALCIPLTAVSDSGPILPLLVILGASVSTCVIWLTGNRGESEEMTELRQSVAQLHHRVASLEIASSDEELRRSIERLSRQQNIEKP